DALQEDIDAVEFGEFDDDDNYTIDELLDLDPDESPPRDGDDSPDEAEDAAEVEEEEDDSIVEKDAESAVASDRLPADRPSPEPPASQSSPDSPTDSSDSDGSITPPDSSEGTDPDEVTASASDETTGPTSDGTTASTPVESSASADGDATNEFVFGGSQEDASDSRAGFGDEIGESRDETADPDEAAEAGGDQTGGAGESATEATSASVPDPDSVPDSVPDADLDVELSGDLDVGSDDEWDDSGMDVSVDEEMAEFESRFGDLLGGGPGEETAGDGPTFRAAVSTIEESRLDADDFPTAAATPDPEGPGEFDRLQETTVDVETADQLLNVAEELSLTHLRLDEAVGPETDEAISEEVANLRRVVTEYRRTVMDVRLVPLQTAVDSVPRTVRDVARSQDKDVELVLEDADVELDRSIIDELWDPLVHVARNAVDHGIESPDDRVAAGKPPEGTIEIRAERVGDRVVIEVSDDGRGIDSEAVRQRAVDTGVLTRKEAKRLDDEEVYDLLFEPGFTTREEVTDVSGRGVGMDVVSRTVADLDGSVTVESVPGEGTTVTARRSASRCPSSNRSPRPRRSGPRTAARSSGSRTSTPSAGSRTTRRSETRRPTMRRETTGWRTTRRQRKQRATTRRKKTPIHSFDRRRRSTCRRVPTRVRNRPERTDRSSGSARRTNRSPSAVTASSPRARWSSGPTATCFGTFPASAVRRRSATARQ
ncbi:hypothetical protein BRD15_04445, partial [Halobacteriales archaeon SW_6_65_15]